MSTPRAGFFAVADALPDRPALVDPRHGLATTETSRRG